MRFFNMSRKCIRVLGLETFCAYKGCYPKSFRFLCLCPEEFITLLWDLLKSINSCKMQDVNVFKEKERRLFEI